VVAVCVVSAICAAVGTAHAADPATEGTHDFSLSTPWTLFAGAVNVVAGNMSFA
jgi:hypothetical protein